MRKTLREPGIVAVLLVVVGLMALFIVYPQVRVVLVPGANGWVGMIDLREGEPG